MAKPNVVSKETLIESAKTCISENGIEKLTLKSVAEQANVSQGTVYYHFRKKENLMLEVVRHMCGSSWANVKNSRLSSIEKLRETLLSAKSRTKDSPDFHRLFLTLIVTGFQNERIKEHLCHLLQSENQYLTEELTRLWGTSPIDGVSLATWGIMLNALIDGLAIQSLVSDDFSTEDVYQELEWMLVKLTENMM
ncbi:TetR/AcrR family transcriptional regulator [Bacillus subtilis]|uniref:TetR/AcrR family transcriptional regulator n=1 Tax=Bacillus subtilis TaxID=1423 RepID=UPI00165CBBAC|nr:TetR/AcrR family transcriptional regulator [Bacillus subtilis]MCY8199113.1 TetR/AcrR family transcriptional regulator [Bacillus subtilis]MEC1444349.1 TetR/AcrR family transcriptional regulator [Bacillus subtilis]MED2970564.1 TetR/AcrR family transcriptional regulator [Bacillus subtilis]